ncbi:MAG: hypothetical protein ACK5MT_04590 [Actinomycetales bacterium]
MDEVRTVRIRPDLSRCAIGPDALGPGTTAQGLLVSFGYNSSRN